MSTDIYKIERQLASVDSTSFLFLPDSHRHNENQLPFRKKLVEAIKNRQMCLLL